MATSCLFAAAVIGVLSISCSHGRYDRKLYIIAPVSDNHQNGGKIYWDLRPIHRWDQGEDQSRSEYGNKEAEEPIVLGSTNSNEHEDYSDDRLMFTSGGHQIHDRSYLKAENILPHDVFEAQTRDGRENRNELINQQNDVSEDRIQDWNPHYEHKFRNIKEDYIKWRQMRDDKLLYSNEQNYFNENQQIQPFSDDKSLAEDMMIRGNRNHEQTIFVPNGRVLDEELGGLSINEDKDGLGDDKSRRHSLKRVRNKRSPKMTRAKILKRKRRKPRRKEIRLQKKKMRIIKDDPEDANYVPSEEDKRPTITYDYSTHEEKPKNDMDEEFVEKMPKRGELGEFGEGESFEEENKAKEVTDDGGDDGKKKKKKDDGDDKPKGGKKGGVKPKGGKKGGKKGDKPKGWRKGGDKGKSKKGGSKKGGGKKGKKDKGKGKKRKAAGRDGKTKQILPSRNVERHDTIDYGQHRSRAFIGNRQRGQDTGINEIRLSSVGSRIDRPQRYVQYPVGSGNLLHPVVNAKQITRNEEDAEIYEREKVLEDFRKIFGQRNTVKLLMDKHRSHLDDNDEKVSYGLAQTGVLNKLNTLNS